MSTAAEFDTYTPRPRYECTRGGVYHIGIKTDKEGNPGETPPVWLSDPIRLIGRGTDGTGSHYRIIEWKDRLTGAAKQAAVPAAEIGSVQGWQRLQSYGLTILSGRAKRERLADYLQTEGQDTPYTVTAQAGWHDKAYILPSGETIQPENTPKGQAKTIYNGDKSQAAAYSPAGTLDDWNAAIGKHLTGNSRLCLAVGTPLKPCRDKAAASRPENPSRFADRHVIENGAGQASGFEINPIQPAYHCSNKTPA